MKTYIEQHWGELDTEVMEILEKQKIDYNVVYFE